MKNNQQKPTLRIYSSVISSFIFLRFIKAQNDKKNAWRFIPFWTMSIIVRWNSETDIQIYKNIFSDD